MAATRAAVNAVFCYPRAVSSLKDLPLDLDTFARIQAEAAEGKAPLDRILARHALTEDAWTSAQGTIVGALAAEAMSDGPTPLGDAYAEALARANDALAPVPQLTPEAWAELAAAFATKGADALAERGLGANDYLRLARHWAGILAREPAVAERYAKAYAAVARGAGR
ncbi:Hypothetical protein A7982_06022 [Minicystis rosea]|nr:Hypothetical protein A7982_06022 [Minicystis rosea]